MWQSKNEQTDSNIADGDKCQQTDSGKFDSGILSSPIPSSSGKFDSGFLSDPIPPSSGKFDSGFLSGPIPPSSGKFDSGFLSGPIPSNSDQALEYDGEVPSSEPVAPEPAALELAAFRETVMEDSGLVMKDSGIDLSESIRKLTVKPSITPYTHSDKPPQQSDKVINEPWPLYYSQDDYGDTQLHIAIVQGFLEVALRLIKMAPHPCLLDMLNDDHQSPLHLAVMTRQSWIARRLILAGADPHLRDSRGNTALHIVCASGDLSCAHALMDPLLPSERRFLMPDRQLPVLPQNLEQPNYDGEMCLHIAAAAGYVLLVDLLLHCGANLEAREALCGRTALHLAVQLNRSDVYVYLLQKCRPCLDAPTYAGITAYQIAACLDSKLARELVKFGATPEPPPESDSESDESEDEESTYLPAIPQLRQGVGVIA